MMSVTKDLGCCLAIIVALLPTVAPTQVVTEPFLGVQRIYETETSPRPLKINVAIIDLIAPDISFRVTPRAPGYPGPYINGSPGETKRQTTRQFADAIGAQLAINADYYATTSSDPSWANNLGLTGSNGDMYSPWEGGQEANFRNALNITSTNQATVVQRPTSVPTGFETVPTVRSTTWSLDTVGWSRAASMWPLAPAHNVR